MTFGGREGDFDPILMRVSVESGEILEKIDMAEVREANPGINIFDLQREKGADHTTHPNDIDPLPTDLAAQFPQFDLGDLLVSYHTNNLIFVLDPKTLKVKWWRVGPWDRQHDPDWNRDGTISVFNNNWRGVGKRSSVVSINPKTYQAKTLVKGSKHKFFSIINGMHEVTPEDTILVTSSTQGRIFEVDKSGEVLFDFINTYDSEEGQTLHVSNARFLGTDFFAFDDLPRCEDG